MNIFNNKLQEIDKEIHEIINHEKARQNSVIELIASENFVSPAVLEAQGSILTNKYAEGYPSKRFYNGCEEVDKAENLAIERVKKLFNCKYANVQPHSGSQANQAVYLALLQPGDTILGMSLDSGGHLTHGSTANMSGKWFNAVSYSVDKETYLIDYEEVERLAELHKPKLLIAGFSAYPRNIDFAEFRRIADKVGAYFMADIAHIAGLVASGEHQSPIPYAHAVTSTTHKTLRGPRGGLILSNVEEIGKKINSALFPGLQGGPLMHIIAAKAVAFLEALQPEYKRYIKQVISNARALAGSLQERGYEVLTGGTDNHIVLIDLRKDGITGKLAANSLDKAGITCNKNAIPFDETSPFITSGIRLGTPACTSRGFKEKDFILVGHLIADILDGLKNSEDNSKAEQKVLSEVTKLMKLFPFYD
ncbi:MAG TPA: serine hydroxymethyltransferase [Rickettsia endosymbiont of Pyrocoelia pectoralis]|nr:serine hydroxymethyltransferase [Rickettsia endosymbiont of Pyrocoelia pectoralis]